MTTHIQDNQSFAQELNNSKKARILAKIFKVLEIVFFVTSITSLLGLLVVGAKMAIFLTIGSSSPAFLQDLEQFIHIITIIIGFIIVAVAFIETFFSIAYNVTRGIMAPRIGLVKSKLSIVAIILSVLVFLSAITMTIMLAIFMFPIT